MAVLILCSALAGCAVTSWSIEGKCSGLPSDPKCEVGGKIGGTFDDSNLLLAQSMMIAAGVGDAALFEIDVSGSTINYPASGTVTLTLKDTTTGVVQAAQLFGWVRSSNIIRLADPDAVNSWALANGGTANELSYSLTKFSMNSGYGEQTIAVKSKYEGSITASAVSTYYRCTTYPSPYQCAMH